MPLVAFERCLGIGDCAKIAELPPDSFAELTVGVGREREGWVWLVRLLPAAGRSARQLCLAAKPGFLRAVPRVSDRGRIGVRWKPTDLLSPYSHLPRSPLFLHAELS